MECSHIPIKTLVTSFSSWKLKFKWWQKYHKVGNAQLKASWVATNFPKRFFLSDWVRLASKKHNDFCKCQAPLRTDPCSGPSPMGLSPGSPKESRLLGLLELHFQQAPVYLGRLCWVWTGPVCHGQCGQCGHSSQEGIYSFSTLQIRLYDQLYWNPTASRQNT